MQDLRNSAPPFGEARSRGSNHVMNKDIKRSKQPESSVIDQREAILRRNAMAKHDLFNSFALIPFVFCNAMCWHWQKLLLSLDILGAYDPTYFHVQTWYFFIYFFVDTAYVAFTPRCVPSRSTVLTHHALVVLSAVLVLNTGWHISIDHIANGMFLIEYNTFWLSLRRWIKASWTIQGALKTRMMQVIEAAYHCTWMLVRLLVAPLTWVEMVRCFSEEAAGANVSKAAVILFVGASLTFVVALGFKWTWNMFWRSAKKDSRAQNAAG